MAYDYAERLCDFPATFLRLLRLSRLSPAQLCDFPARVCDFDRAADLSTGSAAFLFPRLIGGGFHRGGVLPFICIVRKSVVFQTVASVNKKLDEISIKHLTINKTLDILKSSIKHLIIKFEFERGLHYEKDF